MNWQDIIDSYDQDHLQSPPDQPVATEPVAAMTAFNPPEQPQAPRGGGPYYSEPGPQPYNYAPEEPQRPRIGEAASFSEPWVAQVEQQGMDPMAVLNQYYQAVQQAQLSPGERQRAAQLQQSIDSVDAAIANGTFTEPYGRALQAQIRATALPYEIRSSQLPMLRYQLQMQQEMHQHARQVAMDHQAQSFLARTAQDRLQTVMLPNGQTASFVTDAQGRLHEVTSHAEQQQQRALHQHSQLITRIREEVQKEWDHAHTPQAIQARERRQLAEGSDFADDRPDWMRRTEGHYGYNIGPVELRIRDAIAQHYQLLGTAPPGSAPQAAGQANPQAAPAPQPAPAPRTQQPRFDPVEQPTGRTDHQRGVMQTFAETMREIEAAPAHLRPERRAALLAVTRQARTLFAEHGSFEAMPPAVQARYQALTRDIYNALHPETRPAPMEM